MINDVCFLQQKKGSIRAVLVLIFVIPCFFHIEGQTFKKSGVAIDAPSINLKKGDVAYKAKRYFYASAYYKYYIASHTNASKNIWQKLADCYWYMRMYDDCLAAYEHVLQNGQEDLRDIDKIHFAELKARSGHYKEAGRWLTGVPGYEAKAAAYTDSVQQVAMHADSGCWKIGSLNINMGYRQFSPLLYDTILLFSSNRPYAKRTKISDADGMNYARLWQMPLSHLFIDSLLHEKPTPAQISEKRLAGVFVGADNRAETSDLSVLKVSPYIAGAALPGVVVRGFSGVYGNAGTISIDRNHHFYFSGNYDNVKGLNHIRIMEGIYDGKAVSDIKSLPFGGNNSYSVMHPAVNPEGTILVFSSDENGGKGGYDLYYSRRSDTSQSWGEAHNLKVLNTAGNEVFPTITSDGFLYFSSDGRPGFGGLDIYRIPLAEAIAGKDSVEHLPNPINSSADDFGWTQDSTGTIGYFTSDRLNCTDNIYSFYYYPKMITIEGYVKDIKNGQPIAGATVFEYDRSDGKVYVLKTDADGKYSIRIKSDVLIRTVVNPYDQDIPGAKINDISDCLLVSSGKENRTTIVSSNGNSTKILANQNGRANLVVQTPHDFLLNKFTVGMKWAIKNIYYDFDKWDISTDAEPILDSLVSILRSYSVLKVELSSHTDSRGSAAYNKVLSQKRAESAVAYMVGKGIDPKRITAKGYGATQLLNRCAPGVPCSEEEHQENRRTEAKVTGFVPVVEKAGTHEQQIDLTKHKAGEQLDLQDLPKDFFDPNSKKSR